MPCQSLILLQLSTTTDSPKCPSRIKTVLSFASSLKFKRIPLCFFIYIYLKLWTLQKSYKWPPRITFTRGQPNKIYVSHTWHWAITRASTATCYRLLDHVGGALVRFKVKSSWLFVANTFWMQEVFRSRKTPNGGQMWLVTPIVLAWLRVYKWKELQEDNRKKHMRWIWVNLTCTSLTPNPMSPNRVVFLWPSCVFARENMSVAGRTPPIGSKQEPAKMLRGGLVPKDSGLCKISARKVGPSSNRSKSLFLFWSKAKKHHIINLHRWVSTWDFQETFHISLFSSFALNRLNRPNMLQVSSQCPSCLSTKKRAGSSAAWRFIEKPDMENGKSFWNRAKYLQNS